MHKAVFPALCASAPNDLQSYAVPTVRRELLRKEFTVMNHMNKQFVCAGHGICSYEQHVPAPLFRKEFALEALPEHAELSICGLGFYRLKINGQDITKGMLAP